MRHRSFLVALALALCAAAAWIARSVPESTDFAPRTPEHVTPRPEDAHDLVAPTSERPRVAHSAQHDQPAPELAAALHLLAIDRQTGAPISDVAIRRRTSGSSWPNNGEVLASTDHRGRASVPLEHERVVITGPGWSPLKIVLRSTDTNDPERIELVRSTRLYGAVSGAPHGSQVVLIWPDYLTHTDTDLADVLADTVARVDLSPTGDYAFDDLPAAIELSLRVFDRNAGATLRATSAPLVLMPGEARRLDIDLAAGARIVGIVREADGSPAEGIEIRLVDTQQGRPGMLESFWRPIARATTDDEGTFTFESVAAGRWYVGPAANRWDPEEQRYFPPSIAVDVPENAADVPVALELVRGRYVTGRVLAPDGTAARGHVMTDLLTSPGGPQDSTDERGNFHVGPLPRQPLQIVADPPHGKGPNVLAPSESHELDAWTDEIDLTLRAGAAITVHAVDATGELVPARFTITTTLSSRVSRPEPRPTTFSSLEPGEARILAQTGDGRAGFVPHVRLPIGEHIDNFTVEVTAAGTLEIEYVPGEGAEGKYILNANVRRNEHFVTTITTRPGKFEAASFPPGRYDLELRVCDWSTGLPVVQHREVRVVDVIAGETARLQLRY